MFHHIYSHDEPQYTIDSHLILIVSMGFSMFFSKVFHGFSKVFHGFPPPLDIQSLLQVFFFRLAKAAGGLQARLVQEWLAQQAAAGLLDFDPKKGRLGRKEHQKSG